MSTKYRGDLHFGKGQPPSNEPYTKLWYLNKWMMMNASPFSGGFFAIPYYRVIITCSAVVHTHTHTQAGEKVGERASSESI